MKKLIYLLLLAAVVGSRALAQSTREDSPEDLKSYVPILPAVRAQYFNVDPKLGYAVKEMGGGGVYVISDNGWQSALLVTNEDVIVFGAPESFGKSIPSVIAKMTDKPIKNSARTSRID